jgi:hypothetical protein
MTSSPTLLPANAPSVRCQTLKSAVRRIVAVHAEDHVVKVDALVVHVVNTAIAMIVVHVHAMTVQHATTVAMIVHVSTVTIVRHVVAVTTVLHAVVANSVIVSSVQTIVQHATTDHVSTVTIARLAAVMTVVTIGLLAAVTTAHVSTVTASAMIAPHVHVTTAPHADAMIAHAETTAHLADHVVLARVRAPDHAVTHPVAARSLHAVTKTLF